MEFFSNHVAAACNHHRALGLGLRWRHSRQEQIVKWERDKEQRDAV